MLNMKMNHWWLIQRITALLIIALVPAMLYSAIEWSTLEFKTLRHWFTFGRAFIFGIFMTSVFIHSFVGIETIIEDYIPLKLREKALVWSKWIHIAFVCLTWISLIILTIFGAKK